MDRAGGTQLAGTRCQSAPPGWKRGNRGRGRPGVCCSTITATTKATGWNYAACLGFQEVHQSCTEKHLQHNGTSACITLCTGIPAALPSLALTYPLKMEACRAISPCCSCTGIIAPQPFRVPWFPSWEPLHSLVPMNICNLISFHYSLNPSWNHTPLCLLLLQHLISCIYFVPSIMMSAMPRAVFTFLSTKYPH